MKEYIQRYYNTTNICAFIYYFLAKKIRVKGWCPSQEGKNSFRAQRALTKRFTCTSLQGGLNPEVIYVWNFQTYLCYFVYLG
jgi:hypothetical protein